MKPPAFLLDEWLNRRLDGTWSIKHDLASSTGPLWTMRQITDLAGEKEIRPLWDTPLAYGPMTGSLELREAIAEFEGVSPETVQVVTGGAEALTILFLLAAEPGSNVVVPHPGFPTFEALPATFGTEIRPYRLRSEDGFRIDLDEVIGRIDRATTLVLVNTPHNPTGSVIEPEALRKLHDLCAERKIAFVVDQVYHPIYYGRERPSAATLPKAIVIGDFSKALCLPGLRVGWIVDRDAVRRERYRTARSYLTVSNAAVSECLALVAMRHREAIFERARRVAAANLALTASFMDRFADVVGWVPPAGGFVTFPWLKDDGNTRPLCEDLARNGLLLAPGDCFGEPAHFRLGVGAQAERFEEALDRLAAALARDVPRAAARA